jgi:hypothetical protein
MTLREFTGSILAALGVLLAASQVFTLHPIPAVLLLGVALGVWGGCLIVDGPRLTTDEGIEDGHAGD